MSVKIGIIGVGNIGNTHLENIAKGLVKNTIVTAICDIDTKRMESAISKHQLKDCKTFTDYKEMIDSKCVDAVLIATPHYDHPTIAIYSLKNNIHTMVEKPAGVYTKQVEEMNEVAKKYPNAVFSMMYNQRTNPLYQKVHQLVHSGQLGEIKRTNWIITNWYRSNAYYNQGGWRATWGGEGGGVLLNQDPHQLDLWQWICGMPVKVRCYCKFGSNRPIAVDDDVTAYVEYENGATGVFVTSVHDYPGSNRFEISGTKGQIIIEKGIATFYRLKIDEKVFNKENTLPFGKPEFETIELDVKENAWGIQHAELLSNFIEAILNKTPLLAPGEEGINGLRISNAMHLSTWLNGEVDINFNADLFLEELKKRIKIEGRKQ